jgi:hypothetical protein
MPGDSCIVPVSCCIHENCCIHVSCCIHVLHHVGCARL